MHLYKTGLLGARQNGGFGVRGGLFGHEDVGRIDITRCQRLSGNNLEMAEQGRAPPGLFGGGD